MSKEIWIICLDEERIYYELAGAVRHLRGQRPELECSAIFFGEDYIPILGCEKVYLLKGAGTESDSRGRILASAIEKYKPEIVLASSTGTGRSICSIAAAKVGTGLTADCTGLEFRADGSLSQTRPALGGNLIADIICPEKRPQMATVRQGVFPEIVGTAAEYQLIKFEGILNFRGSQLIESRKLSDGKRFLFNSRIIVSGGFGIGSLEDFKTVEYLAQVLGGCTAASRAAVNAGYAPYHKQVGLSGVSVKPDVYIALGISGAVQHLAGVRLAKKIIAVNNDPKAPIFRYADIGIVADWREYIEQLLKQISVD